MKLYFIFLCSFVLGACSTNPTTGETKWNCPANTIYSNGVCSYNNSGQNPNVTPFTDNQRGNVDFQRAQQPH
jgi:hypothetical protein